MHWSGLPQHLPATAASTRWVRRAGLRLDDRDQPGRTAGGVVQSRCGLPLATYFSGVKLRWLLDHPTPALAAAVAARRVRFGTVDTWLLWVRGWRPTQARTAVLHVGWG
jgi:glycerol kinase